MSSDAHISSKLCNENHTPIKIETRRLMIREFGIHDWENVHTYTSDPVVTQYTDFGPNTEEDTRRFIQYCMEQQKSDPRKHFDFAIIQKADQSFVGHCGMHLFEPEQGDIGYVIDPTYWRLGFASEASQALLTFGFETLQLHRITANCDPDNIGSRRVMEKIGLRKEASFRKNMFYKRKWNNTLIYAMLREEYFV